MAYHYLYVNNYINEIKTLCPKRRYVLVLHKHLGDVFYAIGAKDAFKRTYGEPLFFIVRPQHEFLMKLWQVQDYAVYDLDQIIKKNDNFKKSYFKGKTSSKEELDRLENEFFQAAFPCIPTKDSPFVCENPINNFFSYDRYWCYRWATNMGVEEDFRFPLPKGNIPLSTAAQRCITNLGGLDKIILLAPEAATAIELPPEWWAVISNIANEKGYKILINSNRIHVPHTYSAFDFHLTLEDVVSIGLRCHAVFALRSGLCDVLVSVGRRLFVISPAMLRREEASLSIPFNEYTGVHEYQLKNWEFPKFIWEGQDIGKRIQILMDANRLFFWRETILSLLKPKSQHTFWRRCFNNICGRGRVFPENNIENPLTEKIIKYKSILLYSSRIVTVDNQRAHVRSIFNGMISSLSSPSVVKITCLGFPLYSAKLKRHKIVKIAGIPVFFKSREREFNDYITNVVGSFRDKYTDVIILRHNIGENVIYLANIRKWIEASGMKAPVVIAWRQKDIPLYRLFCGTDVPVEYVRISQSDINSFFRQSNCIVANVNIHIPTYRISEAMKERLKGGEKVNFVKFIEDSVQIGSGNFRLPAPGDNAFNEAALFLRQHDVTEKYIIICPEATSLTPISREFWITLCQALADRGYKIIVNHLYHEAFIPGAISSSLPIDVLFVLASRSNGFISLASGLAVLLSLAGVRGDLIYTKFRSKSIGYSAKLAKKIYSVHHIKSIETESICEHIYDEMTVQELLNDILTRY